MTFNSRSHRRAGGAFGSDCLAPRRKGVGYILKSTQGRWGSWSGAGLHSKQASDFTLAGCQRAGAAQQLRLRSTYSPEVILRALIDLALTTDGSEGTLLSPGEGRGEHDTGRLSRSRTVGRRRRLRAGDLSMLAVARFRLYWLVDAALRGRSRVGEGGASSTSTTAMGVGARASCFVHSSGMHLRWPILGGNS